MRPLPRRSHRPPSSLVLQRRQATILLILNWRADTAKLRHFDHIFGSLVSKRRRCGFLMAEESLGRVPVSLSPRDRFVEYLQSRGMRVTQQRLALVEHVFSRHEHFDADQLMEQLPSS